MRIVLVSNHQSCKGKIIVYKSSLSLQLAKIPPTYYCYLILLILLILLLLLVFVLLSCAVLGLAHSD